MHVTTAAHNRRIHVGSCEGLRAEGPRIASGLGAHTKGDEDRYVGVLKQLRITAAKTVYLTKPSCLKSIYEKHVSATAGPHALAQFILDWLPTRSKMEWMQSNPPIVLRTGVPPPTEQTI